jgi:RNA polymerase sporulation-specific sigma factor
MVKTTEAQQALCTENMKLVTHCIKKFFPSSGIPWEELRACGDLGLVQAAATFSPENGASFSTYACACIDHEICKLLRQHKKHRAVTESLDDILAGTDSMRLYDVLPDDTDLTEAVDRKLLAASLMERLRALPKKQREVWELRLGLAGEPPMKQKEIAARLGCSRARISKILQDSSEKITGGVL